MVENGLMTESVAAQYKILIDTIQNTRANAGNKIVVCPQINDGTNAVDAIIEGSFENWSVINCSEIWGARSLIEAGYRYIDLDFTAYKFRKGTIHEPCNNCVRTFAIKPFVED